MFDESLDMEIWRKPQLPHLSGRQREQLCHDLKLRIVKAVRPGLGSVLPLLMEPDINLHVFHLVRDPRAVANSVLKKEGWIDMFPTSMICENIRESLRVLREFNKTELLEQRYTLVRYEDLVADPEMEARRLFRRLGFRLPDNVLRFISTHSKRHYTSPAILREKPTLQPSTTTTRRPSTARKPPRKQLLTFIRWLLGKYRTATTTTEAGPIIIPTSAPDVHDYFGTVRDASFNGLQWLEELPLEKRREVESHCGDVLADLNYPLVYSQERVDNLTEVSLERMDNITEVSQETVDNLAEVSHLETQDNLTVKTKATG
ncbi:uncharacterized protein LOC122374407 [Amphibalanus amphitrite]|uniref:uncharacterized protein LOC122374407 n=1 Tax=Amphibalanus amphitrite TaxID=1232801 RepID=UPI001C918A83|nr:uncharacterized protein LOC122374407 [Amphibalanus amphitrite]